MKPIEFEGRSKVLTAPASMTEEECGKLPILHLDDTCISCWQMSWRERIKALWTGKVWLGVLSGRTQPPVYVTLERPFMIQGTDEKGRAVVQ